jgi:hypothetical protein
MVDPRSDGGSREDETEEWERYRLPSANRLASNREMAGSGNDGENRQRGPTAEWERNRLESMHRPARGPAPLPPPTDAPPSYEQAVRDGELQWLDETMEPRRDAALDRLDRIYGNQPEILAQRSQHLLDGLRAYRTEFLQRLSRDDNNDAGNAPAQERRRSARRSILPLSREDRQEVINVLDERLARRFPEVYEPAPTRPETLSTAARPVDLTNDERPPQSASRPARPYQEEHSPPGAPGSAARPIDLTFEERPRQSASRDSGFRRSPQMRPGNTPLQADRAAADAGPPIRSERDALRAERRAAERQARQRFMAEWRHDRQPDLDEIRAGVRAIMRGASASNGQEVPGRTRTLKRTRDAMSGDERSGDNSGPGGGPSSRPSARPRLTYEDAADGDEVARQPNQRDRQHGERPSAENDENRDSTRRDPASNRGARRTFNERARERDAGREP